LEDAATECLDYCVDDVWPHLEWYHLSRLLQYASEELQSTLEDRDVNAAAVLSERRDKEMRSGNGNGVTVNVE
jgi:hypothetical protein